MYSEIFTNLGPHGMKKQQNILFMMCVASINPMSLTCYQYALNSKIPETKSFSVFSILLFNTFRNQVILQFFAYIYCVQNLNTYLHIGTFTVYMLLPNTFALG